MHRPAFSKLGRYDLINEIGRGAMGVVYEGYDPKIGRTVAIKTIQYEQNIDLVRLRRFNHEAKAAGRLNHPHIVTIYEYDEDFDANVAFIAMEFIQGKELKHYFDEGRKFPMPEIERIMCELLDGLSHAHSLRVTHRDLKPSNIFLLDSTASVKISDFGIARIDSSDLTLEGSIFGTPTYMSPEQFLGETVDQRADLFACGVILYQFLTNERPFTGSVATLMHKVMKELYLPPTAVNKELDPVWDIIMKRALARDAKDRYQSADEFAKAIKQAVSGKLDAEWTMPQLQRQEPDILLAPDELPDNMPTVIDQRYQSSNKQSTFVKVIFIICVAFTGFQVVNYMIDRGVFTSGKSVLDQPVVAKHRVTLVTSVIDTTESKEVLSTSQVAPIAEIVGTKIKRVNGVLVANDAASNFKVTIDATINKGYRLNHLSVKVFEKQNGVVHVVKEQTFILSEEVWESKRVLLNFIGDYASTTLVEVLEDANRKNVQKRS